MNPQELDGTDGFGTVLPQLRDARPSGAQAPRRRDREHTLSAALPGMVFRLERRQRALCFTYVSDGSHEVLDLEPEALRRDADRLFGCLLCADGEALHRSLEASAQALSTCIWQGQAVVREAPRTLQWVARPQRRTAGRVVWTGLLLDVTTHGQEHCALQQVVGELHEAVARERLRSEALVAACERLAGTTKAAACLRGGSLADALRRLALGLAHEINNPLAGIQFMFDALRGRRPLSAAQRQEYRHAIEAGLGRIRQTVGSLLQYAQPEPPRAEAVSLADVVREAAAQAAAVLRCKRQRLAIGRGALQRRVVADRRLVVQALVNVLLNASHASPPAATIALSAARRPRQVGLKIADSGAGIPAQYLHQVCDPFFTTKPQGEGCGLGLAIGRQCMEQQHGELHIESVEGSGTSVWLWLPAA